MAATYKMKIAFVGESSVGKSSIIDRYTSDSFHQHNATTSGSFQTKTVLTADKKANVILNIWDTAGQEVYRSLSALYYRDADAVVIVYDVTNTKSYHNLIEYWLKEIQKNALENCIVTIVGNKIDMAFDIDFDLTEISAVATKYNAKMQFTSAKDNINIKQVFEDIVARKFPQFSLMPSVPPQNTQPSLKTPDSTKVRLRAAQGTKRKKANCC